MGLQSELELLKAVPVARDIDGKPWHMPPACLHCWPNRIRKEQYTLELSAAARSSVEGRTRQVLGDRPEAHRVSDRSWVVGLLR